MYVSAKLRLLEHRQQRISEVRAKYQCLKKELEQTKQYLMLEPHKWTTECKCSTDTSGSERKRNILPCYHAFVFFCGTVVTSNCQLNQCSLLVKNNISGILFFYIVNKSHEKTKTKNAVVHLSTFQLPCFGHSYILLPLSLSF